MVPAFRLWGRVTALGRRVCSTWSKEFASEDAYQVLGLPRDCTDAAIKKAFQQLAKVTHPDLQQDSKPCAARFIRVLAAYQILSDPQKRTLYDSELSSRERSGPSRQSPSASGFKRSAERPSRTSKTSWDNPHYEFDYEDGEDADVVEWLRQYRSKVSRLVHQRELGKRNSKIYESMHADFRTALRNIYFGPDFRVVEGFPDAFEAEERSDPWVTDILQLVYGRFLFATVRPVRDEPKKLHGKQVKQQQQGGSDQNLWEMVDRVAYDKIELRLNGKAMAHALRRPLYTAEHNDEVFVVDSVSVYLLPEDERNAEPDDKLLGTIQGLAATEAGMQCVVFDADGKTTHTVLQHTTPLVKHLHWYRLGSGGMNCDCRCRRAWMLPSRYWLFKPRNSTHNIGGWYIETFKPRSRARASSKLHPAMYILAAAYKTLDKEAIKRKKPTNVLRVKVSGFYNVASRMWMSLKRKWKRS